MVSLRWAFGATGASPTSCARSRSRATSPSSPPGRCSSSSAARACCAPRRPRSASRRGCAARAAAGSPPSTRCSRAPRRSATTARLRAGSSPVEPRRSSASSAGRCARSPTSRTMGEVQITVDCDVLQADGGTRTASICGGYVALHDACSRLVAAEEDGRAPDHRHVRGDLGRHRRRAAVPRPRLLARTCAPRST